MDLLSVTASLITICQLANEVVQYFNDARDAPKECQQCVIEAANLLGPLISLRCLSQQAQDGNFWLEQLRKLNVEDGPLDQYKEALKLLRTSVEIGDGKQKIRRRLLWRFNKEQVEGILRRLQRLNALVSTALEMDHRQASQNVKGYDVLTYAGSCPTRSKTTWLLFELAFLLCKRALLLLKQTSRHFILRLVQWKTTLSLLEILSHSYKQILLLSETIKVCSITKQVLSGFRQRTIPFSNTISSLGDGMALHNGFSIPRSSESGYEGLVKYCSVLGYRELARQRWRQSPLIILTGPQTVLMSELRIYSATTRHKSIRLYQTLPPS